MLRKHISALWKKLVEWRSHVLLPVHVDHKTSFFSRSEHLGGRHKHQKMPDGDDGDDHTKNLVHRNQGEHNLLNLKFHATAVLQFQSTG